MQYDEYEIGQRVQVSDGAKRPPERFNRKLAAWKRNNYIGLVFEIVEPGTPFADGKPFRPYGGLVLKKDDYPDRSWITFQFQIPLGGHLKVRTIAEAEAA